jgi:hypothetical protein
VSDACRPRTSLLAVGLICVLGSLLAVGLALGEPARAATIYSYQAKPPSSTSDSRRASAARRSAPVSSPNPAQPAPHAPSTPPRAPSGPPLNVGSSGEQGPSASAPPSGEDALTGNGLGSPLCSTPDELPVSARQNCETADFIAASDPTGDYAFDVNINTGIGDVSNDLDVTIQNLARSGWMTFVAVAHGLIVMFEWCYSLNLLSGALLGEITRALHNSRLMFTEPWLAFVLSIASVLAVYHGLIRRRVAETLGQALAMLAMMAGGLWVIADPAGTVGALERWTNQASLGTLAVVASGTPNQPERTLAGDMQTLFGGAVAGPWCFLEFGEVEWCRSPGALDSRLRSAALVIARHEQSQSGCSSLCSSNSSARDRTLAASAALLRAAQTNAQLFLALPANEAQRNSVTTEGALLNVLCGGGKSADKCSGPTAAQAEFRSEKGTEPRVIGLALIWAGGLGMLLLFGFIALRLLMAALYTLFYLLLAPAAVLAPALGDGGRSAFRTWAMRLLEALVAKLIYSFLLGATLMMTSTLLDLNVLGWLSQWLLISAFWWTAFFKRGQMVGLIEGTTRGAGAGQHRLLARRAQEALETPRMALAPALWAWRRLHSPAPDPERMNRRRQAARETTRKRAEEQVTSTLDRDHEEARARVRTAPRTQTQLSGRREQLQRVKRERQRALVSGDGRRAALLGVRERRIEGEIAREQRTLNEARRTVAAAESAQRVGGSKYTREQREQRARFLDEQAALPASARGAPNGQRRDYASLASLAGHGREQYERLSPREQRETRLRIDRELARRSHLGDVAQDVARERMAPSLGRREQRKVDRELDRALEQRMRDDGYTPPSKQPKPSALDTYLEQSPYARAGESPRAQGGRSRPRSPVMDDAREVEGRRKRQLGWERSR